MQPEESLENATGRVESRAMLQEFSSDLSSLQHFIENYTVPAVLELVGKLGGLNRGAVTLIEAVARDMERLHREQDAGDLTASDETQRLLMELRKLSEEVQQGLGELTESQQMLAESVRISGEVIGYLSHLREMLSDELWEKR
jgi:hypothetical protein